MKKLLVVFLFLMASTVWAGGSAGRVIVNNPSYRSFVPSYHSPVYKPFPPSYIVPTRIYPSPGVYNPGYAVPVWNKGRYIWFYSPDPPPAYGLDYLD